MSMILIDLSGLFDLFFSFFHFWPQRRWLNTVFPSFRPLVGAFVAMASALGLGDAPGRLARRFASCRSDVSIPSQHDLFFPVANPQSRTLSLRFLSPVSKSPILNPQAWSGPVIPLLILYRILTYLSRKIVTATLLFETRGPLTYRAVFPCCVPVYRLPSTIYRLSALPCEPRLPTPDSRAPDPGPLAEERA
jgi:hypothetical protein